MPSSHRSSTTSSNPLPRSQDGIGEWPLACENVADWPMLSKKSKSGRARIFCETPRIRKLPTKLPVALIQRALQCTIENSGTPSAKFGYYVCTASKFHELPPQKPFSTASAQSRRTATHPAMAVVKGSSAIGTAGLRALSDLLPREELSVPCRDSETAHKRAEVLGASFAAAKPSLMAITREDTQANNAFLVHIRILTPATAEPWSIT